jgi:hypothetical protein
MKISPILSQAGDLLIWKCPGCKSSHGVRIRALSRPGEDDGPGWGWNNDAERPTFTPSVLVTYDGRDAGVDGAPPAICHSFIVDGQMQFLADCTHGLAGQTVPIPPWLDGELM